MRILKVSRCFYPAAEYGGPIWKMLAIAKGLANRGHSVTVYTSNLANPERKLSSKTVAREVDASRVVYFNSLFTYHWDSFNPGIFRYCRDELRGFDIIHVYGYRDFLSTVVCSYARNWAIPYVIEPMGMYVPIVRSLTKKRIYDWIWGRRLVAGAQKIIATSELEQKELSLCGLDPDKVMVRRNGVDLTRFDNLPPRGRFRERLNLSPSEKLVLYLGRTSRKKGIDLLIRAFAGEISNGAKLAVVGPDDHDGYLNELIELVRALGLEQRVAFTGPLYEQEKLEAYVDATVFVLPSRNENFGNAAAEAVACGTPVIVTDRCGIASYVLGQRSTPYHPQQSTKHDGSLKVKIDNRAPQPGATDPYMVGRVGLVVTYEQNALQNAMARVLTDEQLRRRLRHNALQARQELSWDEPVQQMEELYKGIIGMPGRAGKRQEESFDFNV